jgi:hypothetical protein
VIAVFTKYDQFKREVKMKLEDRHPDVEELDTQADAEAEKIFTGHFLADLEGSPFVRLESGFFLTN